MRFEYAGRTTLISGHAVIRWMERVEGRDLQPIRRLVESVLPIGRPGDKMLIQMIEKGFGVNLDPYREAIRKAVQEGRGIERGQGFDVVTRTGHVVCLRKDHGPGYNVATVLTEEMWTEERSAPDPARANGRHEPEDEADVGHGPVGGPPGHSLREDNAPQGRAEDPVMDDEPPTE